jgi:hypothetical protein
MKKLIVCIIILLFIGASVVSASGHIVESKEEILIRGNVYAYCLYDPTGELDQGFVYFDLDDPGTIDNIEDIGNPGLLSAGTWTLEDEYVVCDPMMGYIWVIDPINKDVLFIGGGGVGLNGLTYDPIWNQLYGCSATTLYKIDRDTGAQNYVGSFGSGPINMIGLACDSNGCLYGWDTGTDSLWFIDDETAECELVGSLGIDLNYQQDGHFDLYEDELYLAAYTTKGQLYKCDKETGDCTLVGDFQGGTELTAFVIPYVYDPPPYTYISFDPTQPDGENGWYVSDVTVTLYADEEDVITYYRINGEEWNTYTSPFIISEEGENILIEYYSIDIHGQIEDVKSATLDIDKTPPDVTVEWDVERIGWRKWRITLYIIAEDGISGMDRVEFFLNEGHQSTVSGAGPTYAWSFVIHGGIPFSIKVVVYDIAGHSTIVIVNDTDISTYSFDKGIFTSQSNQLVLIKFFEMVPFIQRLLDILRWYD